jgi:hypothetical protein
MLQASIDTLCFRHTQTHTTIKHVSQIEASIRLGDEW